MAYRPGGPGYANRWRTYQRAILGLLAATLLLVTSPVRANDQGSGDRSCREAARRAIPWRSLAPADRREASDIVSQSTLYRQLPTRLIDCDGDLFAYLIDHPEVVVDCWNVMGVSRLRLDPNGPNRYLASDAAGAQGDVRILYRKGGGAEPLTMVVLADGKYQTPPMPHALRGSSLMLLRAQTVEEANGRSYVTTRLDSFISFDQAGTKLVARTLKPLIMRTADQNFVETMKFVSIFNRTAETNPAGMQRLSGHLQRTDEPTRREFAQVCHETSQRYATRRQKRDRVALVQPNTVRR